MFLYKKRNTYIFIYTYIHTFTCTQIYLHVHACISICKKIYVYHSEAPKGPPVCLNRKRLQLWALAEASGLGDVLPGAGNLHLAG